MTEPDGPGTGRGGRFVVAAVVAELGPELGLTESRSVG